MTAAIPAIAEAAAGGEAAEAGGLDELGSDIPSDAIDLGDGHKLELSPEQFKQLLHDPIVVEALRQRAQLVADAANQMKSKPRAVYEVLIQNNPDTTRARAFVRPGNADAFYDDAVNSTMLKAAATVPSDPRLESGGNSGEDDSGGEDEANADSNEADAEAADAAEAEAAEVAEVAIVAI